MQYGEMRRRASRKDTKTQRNAGERPPKAETQRRKEMQERDSAQRRRAAEGCGGIVVGWARHFVGAQYGSGLEQLSSD